MSTAEEVIFDALFEHGAAYARSTAKAILRALREAGMVVVPLEPTEKMCSAGGGLDNGFGMSVCDSVAETVYRAMIQAGTGGQEGGQ